MKIKKWEAALVIAVVMLLISGFCAENQAEAISEKLIRIHVVANSDFEYDQALKLKVRDAVIQVVSPVLEKVKSRAEAELAVQDSMAEAMATAENVIAAEGYDYEVQAQITQEYFPTVDYETFSLPAGEYKAFRVVIGEGQGHNWWCVIFPSLCTEAIIEAGNSDAELTEEEAAFITEENTGYVIKFKLAEIIGEIKSVLFG